MLRGNLCVDHCIQWQTLSETNTHRVMWCQQLSQTMREWDGHRMSLETIQHQEHCLRWSSEGQSSSTSSLHTVDKLFIQINHRTMKKLFFSVVLMIIAVVLYRFVWLVGFFVEVIVQAIRWPRHLAEYFRKIAISVDQLWNVTCPTLMMGLFLTWEKKDPIKFGHEDETVSSVLGKNKEIETLSRVGRRLDSILNRLDPWHSLNSIERDEG